MRPTAGRQHDFHPCAPATTAIHNTIGGGTSKYRLGPTTTIRCDIPDGARMSKHHERRHKANPKSRVTYVDLLRDAAYALRNAKELSIDVGSHDSIDKAKQHGWPIVWDFTGHCYVYTPRDDGILPTDATTQR